MSNTAANDLAEKIARLLQTEAPETNLSSLQKSIEKISERLENIERKLENQHSSNFYSSTFALSISKKHPSQEKFELEEASGHQTDGAPQTEKPCIFEPNGKPCDYCSMCNSRGF